MQGILRTIWDHKRESVRRAKERLPEAALLAEVKPLLETPCRGFAEELRRTASERGAAVIAEVKKASPSKGLIRPDFRPAEIAASYAEGGAACLSVLTEEEFFLGGPEVLREARQTVTLPILRKDFVLDPYQVLEARAWGADAVLLIAAALSADQMRDLAQTASEVGIDVLIESHSEPEIEQALQIPEAMIGINNRNLETFEVSLATTERLKQLIPDDRFAVSESGIHQRADVDRVLAAGVSAFLVGEAFMRKENPGEALKELFYA